MSNFTNYTETAIYLSNIAKAHGFRITSGSFISYDNKTVCPLTASVMNQTDFDIDKASHNVHNFYGTDWAELFWHGFDELSHPAFDSEPYIFGAKLRRAFIDMGILHALP